MKNLLIFLMLSFPLFAQQISSPPPVGQVIVHDIKDMQSAGFVQYRSVLTPLWAPLTAGMRLGEGTLIRLNDPRAQLTLSFPDGSFLRMIGISSFYLDSISRIREHQDEEKIISSYQTRILLLTGRWFHSANPMTPTTFVVNTDVTTSVIFNGSGGGYFGSGRGQMLVRSGQGQFGWRQADIQGSVRSRPASLNPGQIITMDIYKGFSSEVGVVTESNYLEYGLIPDQNTLSFLNSGPVFWPLRHVAQNRAKPKTGLRVEDINFENLDSLKDLDFVRKEDALAVGIARVTTNIVVETPPPPPALPQAIPLSLLRPLNLADFEVGAPNPDTNQLVRIPVKENAPAAAAPRRRQRVQAELVLDDEDNKAGRTAEDVIDLAAATADIAATPLAVPRARRRAPLPAARTAVEEPIVEEQLELEEEPQSYTAPDNFNREHFTNDPAFQYTPFQVNDIEDLIQGDFSRSLFY